MHEQTQDKLTVTQSLARGLRSDIQRSVQLNLEKNTQRLMKILESKQSIATTSKGQRKLHKECQRVMNAFCVHSLDNAVTQDWAVWLFWDIEAKAEYINWEEDFLVLGVKGLHYPTWKYNSFEFNFPVQVSMHVLERLFLRLKTTNSSLVLSELKAVMVQLNSFYAVIGQYIEKSDLPEKPHPIILPTPHGVVMGDYWLESGKARIVLRTFLSDEQIKGSAKQTAKESINNVQFFLQGVHPDAVLISSILHANKDKIPTEAHYDDGVLADAFQRFALSWVTATENDRS